MTKARSTRSSALNILLYDQHGVVQASEAERLYGKRN
jgi:hypothetical protein